MRVSQELCHFLWCYCSNTLCVVQKPTVFYFQLLVEMSQLWGLSSPFFKEWKCSSHARKNIVTEVFFSCFRPFSKDLGLSWGKQIFWAHIYFCLSRVMPLTGCLSPLGQKSLPTGVNLNHLGINLIFFFANSPGGNLHIH